MGKRTRVKYQAANQFGTVLSKSANYTLTEDNILQDGNQFIKMSSTGTLTLTPATVDLDGIVIRVFTSSGTNAIVVAAGYGGGGASYDTVTPGAYETVDFWCDGSYWYAMSPNVAAA